MCNQQHSYEFSQIQLPTSQSPHVNSPRAEAIIFFGLLAIVRRAPHAGPLFALGACPRHKEDVTHGRARSQQNNAPSQRQSEGTWGGRRPACRRAVLCSSGRSAGGESGPGLFGAITARDLN